MATAAYVVPRALRQFGLEGTDLARAQCDTIRVKLLKIGAAVRVGVRRVRVALSEAYPPRATFIRIGERLRGLNGRDTPAPATG